MTKSWSMVYGETEGLGRGNALCRALDVFENDMTTPDVFDRILGRDQSFLERLRAFIQNYHTNQSQEFFDSLFAAPEWKEVAAGTTENQQSNQRE